MANQPAKGRKTPARARKTPATAPAMSESTGPLIDRIPPEQHPELSPIVLAKPVSEPAAPKKQAVASEASKPTEASKPAETPKPAATEQKTETVKPAESAPARSGGFLPLLLGGIAAGVIGFAVATLTTPSTDGPLADQVARQAAAIAALEDRLAALPADAPATDLSGVEATQAELSAEIDRLDSALAALAERFDTLPRGTGGAAPDLSAYEAEIAELRAQMEQELESVAESAMSQLETARAEAAAIEENAASAARIAASRAALARVQTALESGAPLGVVLDDLEEASGSPAPDALATARDGVPTLASLQESFPDAARRALATARSEGVAGENAGGFTAFLRNQLDVRSVAPREGDDADAILSRAEAAVKSGRLSDALAELAALPEVARAEMSDWLGRAEARASAVMAADTLATSLNDN